MVIQRVSVNASRLAVPPKRVPVPESKMPPKGTFASSSTVCSLMCTMPVGILRARSRPRMTSLVRMPSDRPYSVWAASAAASSAVENLITGATGPNTSCAQAGISGVTSDSTVGW
jgi:hypothetical protein